MVVLLYQVLTGVPSSYQRGLNMDNCESEPLPTAEASCVFHAPGISTTTLQFSIVMMAPVRHFLGQIQDNSAFEFREPGATTTVLPFRCTSVRSPPQHS